MSVSLGNISIKDMYYGSTKIGEAYLGSTKVYGSGQPIPQGYTYFLWYVDYYDNNLFHQQDFALYDSKDSTTKITGFTSIAGQTSSNPGSENYPNGFDGNSNTKWYSSDTYPNWCIFTKDQSINPVGLSYMTANDQSLVSNRSPRAFKLCGSNVYTTDPNDSNWVTIYETSNNPIFVDVSNNKVWVDLYF